MCLFLCEASGMVFVHFIDIVGFGKCFHLSKLIVTRDKDLFMLCYQTWGWPVVVELELGVLSIVELGES